MYEGSAHNSISNNKSREFDNLGIVNVMSKALVYELQCEDSTNPDIPSSLCQDHTPCGSLALFEDLRPNSVSDYLPVFTSTILRERYLSQR